MTKSDQYDETRCSYKALETFIDENGPTIRGSGFDTLETQGAHEALQWIKTYIVSLELQAEQRQQSDIETARRPLHSHNLDKE